MTEIDWKAVERGEQKVRHKEGSPVTEAHVFPDGWVAVCFDTECRGIYSPRALARDFELIPPEPKRHTVWLNLYEGEACGPYKSREDADDMANGRRLECREITWTVPQ